MPLHIVYVNESDGTPPQNSIRISEMVAVANEIWDSIANFYVCGYDHVNNSDLANFRWGFDREPLYDLNHFDEAVNVYFVRSMVDAASGLAAFPWFPKNNMVVLIPSVSVEVLAHELGHVFGLYHTHEGNSNFPTCNRLDPTANPLTTGDLIDDTPVDPSQDICPNPIGCPKATSSCTSSCPGGPTYTYTGFWTNNIMSYYRSCQPTILTKGQKDRVLDHLATHPGLAYLRNGLEPTCNNEIAEIGYIKKYCQYAALNPDIIPIKDLQVNLRNELTGWEGSVKRTDTVGEYSQFANDYSNLSIVTIKPRPSHPNINMILDDSTAVPENYDPWNGCNVSDILLTQKHILHGGNVLIPPYGYIAADVNTDGGITSFDMVNMRKIYLRLVPDFPSGTWHYVPEYYFNNSAFESGFNQNPFLATYSGVHYPLYMDQAVLDMDDVAVANPNNWSFRAIKMGDVNCSMIVDEFSSPDGSESGLVTSGFGESTCVTNNDVITVQAQGIAGQPIVGYQMGIEYDQNKLHYLGNSAGNLVDYSADNFAEHDGQIRTLWNKNDFVPEALSAPKNLFNLHFKVLEGFCNLSGVLGLNDEVEPGVFYNSNVESVSGNLLLNYYKEIPQGYLLSIYPNPATNAVNFSIELNQPNLVEIRISDYLGQAVNMTQSYNAGTFSCTFPNLNALANGLLNYTVKIGNLTFSGVLLKSQS